MNNALLVTLLVALLAQPIVGLSPISVNLTSVVAEGVVSWIQPTCR